MKPFASSTTWGVLAVCFLFALFPFSAMWPASFLAQFWWWVIVAAHLLFSLGIARDAVRRHERDELLFFEPAVWTLTVAVFGMAAIALYWLMHYSRLKGE